MNTSKYKPKSVVENEQIVYFRLRRPKDEQQPQEELIVNRNPTKRRYKFEEQNQQDIQISDEKLKQNAEDLVKILSKFALTPSQYFLRRVDEIDISYNTKSQQILNKDILPKSNTLATKGRAQNREKLIQKSRGLEVEKSKNIKIMDIEDNFVEFGNEKIEVENLGTFNEYYYILQKRNAVKEGPTVQLPQQAQYLFDKVQFQQHISDEEDHNQDDDEDSNRESNPDFDYPQQDYDGNSDEGVIQRDYYPGCSDDDRGSSQPELDEEQIYRQYLKRCKKAKHQIQEDDDEYFL